MKPATSQSDLTETKRLAIFCLSALGDLVNTIPLVVNCRRIYPSAQILLICARNRTTEFARAFDVADLIIQIAPNARRSPVGLWKSLRKVRAVQADIAFQSFASHGSFGNLLMGATGARIRCGFENGRFRDRLTHRVPVVEGKHYILLNLDLLRRLGHLDVAGPTDRFLPDIEQHSERFSGNQAIIGFGRYAVISLGSDPILSFKRWPVYKWAQLCRLMAADGITPVFVGDLSEQELVEETLGEAGLDGVNLVGQTDVHDLAALIASSLVVIGTDGMILHLAAAMGKRCVGIFGPTNPMSCGPWNQLDNVVKLDMPCSPCYTNFTIGRPIVCTTHECLHFLPVQSVFERAATSWRGVPDEPGL